MDYDCFFLIFRSRAGIAAPPCILQCASGEGAQCSDRAVSLASTCRDAHNAHIQATLWLLKSLLRGEVFVALCGKFHKQDVSNEKRSQGWHFSVLLIPRQLQLYLLHVLGISAHPSIYIPLLIWAQSSTTCLSCHCDSPESATDHQANASAPSFVVAQTSKCPRKVIWNILRLFLCREMSLFSPVHRRGVSHGHTWNFPVL